MSGDAAERYYSRRMRLLDERRALQEEWDFLARKASSEWLVDNIGPGWRPIVVRLHEELLELDPDYRLESVGEELGGLFFVARFSLAKQTAGASLVQAARTDALASCELCGETGVLRSERPQVKTLCDVCWSADRACAERRGERYAAALLTQLLSADDDHPSPEEVVAWLDELDAS
jgi:hypothetical protein